MTLQQLKYIVALDDERHFARAAEVAMISQPGLTTQLRNFESEIGIRIFDRSRVPLTPTKEGVAIIARARKVLRESDSIRDLVIDMKQSLEGEIRLGCISTLSPNLIPQLIRKMQVVAPKIRFVITERPTGLLVRELETGIIDIALIATPTAQPGLLEHPVFDEPFVAFLPDSHQPETNADYQITAADKRDLLLMHHEYCYNAQLLDICKLKDEKTTTANFSYEIASVESLKGMVRAGFGFAIVPSLSVTADDENYVRRFANPVPVREISLVTSDSFARQLLVEKMQQALVECLPVEMHPSAPIKKIRWNDSPYFAKKMEQFK